MQCAGFALQWLFCCGAQLLGRGASVVVANGLSCSGVRGILPEQGLNPCLLHWQVDSLPLSHQGSPLMLLLLSRFQSRPPLCDPINGSPPGSPVPGILQAGTLEWVATAFSNARVHAQSLQSCLTLCDPTDGSPPGSSAHEILQARTLE